MNAVIYARYSSDKQTEQSIDGQLRDCYAYAERSNINVVGEYIDRAMSGTNDHRPEFQRMIADSSKKQFDYVIVYKLDRFARNRYDSAVYKRKLKLNNVRVLSVTEHMGEGSEGIILEAVLEAMAEVYSHQLSENTKRGLRESALKCNTIGGNTPLGFKVVDKKYVIDDGTASYVQYIFNARAAGDSKTKILKDVTDKGCRKKNGKPLTFNDITKILTNPKYIGDNYYKGELISHDAWPALVTKNIFDICQQREEASRKAMGGRTKEKVDYMLFGKLFCGYCGAGMSGDSGTSRNGDKHYYYTCSTHKNRKRIGRDCNKKSENKGFIEWYIVEQTVDYVLTPKRIDYIAGKVVELYNAEFNGSSIEAHEKRLSQIEREIDNAVDTLLKTSSKSAIYKINKKLEALDAEKQYIEIEIAKSRIANKKRVEKDDIVKWLKSACKGDAADPKFQEKIIDTFINAVYLFDDKVVIYYNIKGGKQVTYIDMISHLDEISESIDGSSSLYNGEPERKDTQECVLSF